MNPNTTPFIKLHTKTYGQGDPLLCIHGFGASLYTWRYFIEPLSKNHQLILVDLKGAGKSPKPADNHYSTQDHANLLYQLIQELNLRNLTLIGNSFGGALALLISIMLKENGDIERLKSLILIDAGAYKQYVPSYVRVLNVPVIGWAAINLTPPRCAVKMILKRAYYDPRKITDEQIEAYAAPIAAPGGRHALLETGRQIVPPNFDELVEKYKEIKVPTLIVWGGQDGVIPCVVGELLNRAIQNSALRVIDQCGHVPEEEKPDDAIVLLLEFLNGLK